MPRTSSKKKETKKEKHITTKKREILLKSSEHDRFRRSKVWKDFRKKMIKEHPCCAFCGSKRATRTVHHIYECQTKEEYENLDESRFIILCSQCHNFLHWIGRKKNETDAVLQIKLIAKDIGFGEDWIKFFDQKD